MTRDDLRTIVTYCPKEACGEPVGGLIRATQYTKRRLLFAGFVYVLYAKYQCPHCQYTRLFRLSFWETHQITTDIATAKRETRRNITLVAIAVLIVWGVDEFRDFRGTCQRL
jgi:hypothetical protein